MLHVMEYVTAPYYGLDADEIWRRSAGRDQVGDARVPLLILHPEDDPIVKVDQARILAEAAKDNDLVRVWILPHGSHGLLEAADSRWTHAVHRLFFERWGIYPEREPDRPVGEPEELVYSAGQTK